MFGSAVRPPMITWATRLVLIVVVTPLVVIVSRVLSDVTAHIPSLLSTRNILRETRLRIIKLERCWMVGRGSRSLRKLEKWVCVLFCFHHPIFYWEVAFGRLLRVFGRKFCSFLVSVSAADARQVGGSWWYGSLTVIAWGI
jgi:hypothetical protein